MRDNKSSSSYYESYGCCDVIIIIIYQKNFTSSHQDQISHHNDFLTWCSSSIFVVVPTSMANLMKFSLSSTRWYLLLSISVKVKESTSTKIEDPQNIETYSYKKHDDNLSNTNNVESLTNHTSHNIFRWKCRRTNCWSERERNIEKKYIENYYYNLKRLFFILHPSTNMCSSKSFLLSSPSHTNVISIIIFPFHLEDGPLLLLFRRSVA